MVGLGLSIKLDGGRDAQLAVQAWPKQCGSWGGKEWAHFVHSLAEHLKIKPSSLLLQYKLQDRPRRSFADDVVSALEQLKNAAEGGGWLSELAGPVGMGMLAAQMSSVVDRERDADFALQFDIKYYRRAAGFGLEVPDHSAAPAAQYAVGLSATFVRQANGRVFKSVAAFLEHRVAEARRLPGFAEGGEKAFGRMLAALRGGPANAAAAEGVGGPGAECSVV